MTAVELFRRRSPPKVGLGTLLRPGLSADNFDPRGPS